MPSFLDRLADRLAPASPLRLLHTYRARLDTRIAPGDEMWLRLDARELARINESSAAEQYFRVGEAALRAIVKAMVLAEKTTLGTILDLPCGHGRVMRVLKAAFPGARLTACDLSRDAVDHCARAFGARPVYSDTDPAKVALDDVFDLVWCGSLLTHLDADHYRGFVDLMIDRLAPEGILVFTNHGRWSIDYQRILPYIDEGSFRTVAEGYDRDGFGYADYPGQPGYGISIAKPSWVAALVERRRDATLLGYHERGWGFHQDVAVVWKVPIDAEPGLVRPRAPAYRGHYEKFARGL